MDDGGGVRFDVAVTMMMMNVEERIRFLLRTAIRVGEEGDAKAASLFRRMAKDLSAGESAALPGGPVLVAVAD